MTVTINGTSGITSPGGDTAAVSITTPVINSSTGTLSLQANGTTQVNVDGNGMGIGGSASAGDKLYVYGRISSTSINVDGGGNLGTGDPGSNNYWYRYTDGSNYYQLKYFTDTNPTISIQSATGTGTVSFISLNGQVNCSNLVNTAFIGTATGTQVVIDGSGYLRANTSSERYKKDIEPIDVGLEMVLAMSPVKYNLKEGDVPQVGFIAEEFPEDRLVNYSLIDKEDPSKGLQVESVNYGNLTAILVKAIQELTERVVALENK